MNFQIHDSLSRPPGNLSSLSICASDDKLPIAIVATSEVRIVPPSFLLDLRCYVVLEPPLLTTIATTYSVGKSSCPEWH